VHGRTVASASGILDCAHELPLGEAGLLVVRIEALSLLICGASVERVDRWSDPIAGQRLRSLQIELREGIGILIQDDVAAAACDLDP